MVLTKLVWLYYACFSSFVVLTLTCDTIIYRVFADEQTSISVGTACMKTNYHFEHQSIAFMIAWNELCIMNQIDKQRTTTLKVMSSSPNTRNFLCLY